VWWLVFNVDWVGGSFMEHLILVDSFLDVVVNAAGLCEIDVLLVRLMCGVNVSFEMIGLVFEF